jgi:hypothetical protein
VADGGANTGNFIGRNAGTYSTAADEDAAFAFAVDHGAAHSFGIVRIVGRIFVECTDVQNFLAHGAKKVANCDFQSEASVI